MNLRKQASCWHGHDHCRKRYGTKRTTHFSRLKYAAQGMNVSVEFYSPSIIRVYKTPGETASDKESLVVIKAPEQTPFPSVKTGKM